MKETIARHLLKTEAVFLSPEKPFTWASGIKSPIYCDNRLTLAYPETRSLIEESLAKLIKEHYPEVQAVMGTATAGIAHAALVANILELPMGYVRASSKDHGRTNQIEGKLVPGQKVVIVEDLISTAGSVIEVVKVLQNAGVEVLGIVSIFTYGMKKGIEKLQEAQVTNYSLSDFDSLINVALNDGYIVKNHIDGLQMFRENPSDSSWQDSFK